MTIQVEVPTRLSLLGGGSDLPVFFDQELGFVVNVAINIKQRFFISDSVEEWEIPDGSSREFYETIVKYVGFNPKNLTIKAYFDGSIESGLGSSASAARDDKRIKSFKRYKS